MPQVAGPDHVRLKVWLLRPEAASADKPESIGFGSPG